MSPAGVLNLCFCVNGTGTPYLDLSDYHCVTWPLCSYPWHSASARSPTHQVLFFTSSVISLFFTLWPRSIILVRFILWINSQGLCERSAQCPRIAQNVDHSDSSPKRHARTGDK
jgi:hypothetical protein